MKFLIQYHEFLIYTTHINYLLTVIQDFPGVLQWDHVPHLVVNFFSPSYLLDEAITLL